MKRHSPAHGRKEMQQSAAEAKPCDLKKSKEPINQQSRRGRVIGLDIKHPSPFRLNLVDNGRWEWKLHCTRAELLIKDRQSTLFSKFCFSMMLFSLNITSGIWIQYMSASWQKRERRNLLLKYYMCHISHRCSFHKTGLPMQTNIFKIGGAWQEKIEQKGCGIPFCWNGRKPTRMHWACCLPRKLPGHRLKGSFSHFSTWALFCRVLSCVRWLIGSKIVVISAVSSKNL